MRKLFTTNFGSQLYGTATPESDVDVKHVVLPDLNDLLVGKRVQNIVKKTNTKAYTKNSAEDVDEEFIPIQILASDFLDGQTYALELCYAIDGAEASQVLHCPAFAGFCRELRTRFLTSNIKSMMGYAVNQSSLYSNKGERLNALRDAQELFTNMIKLHGPGRTMTRDREEFEHHAQLVATKYPKYFQITDYAIDSKGTMRHCIKLLEKTLPYSGTFENSLKITNAALKRYGSRADAASINNVDWKALSHAVRIVDEGITLLTTGKLQFPYTEVQAGFLLAIKQGKLPYTEVAAELEVKIAQLKNLELGSNLPPSSTALKEELNVWLAQWMRELYHIVEKEIVYE